MKIIDKYSDFYDFYQNIYIDKTVVFDRRGSNSLTKKQLLESINTYKPYYRRNEDYCFIMLHIGYHYWVFLLDITKREDDFWREKVPIDYELTPIVSWVDFETEIDNPIEIFNIDADITKYSYDKRTLKERVIKTIKQGYITIFKRVVAQPILKDLGFTKHIDALTAFNAIEEYLGYQKTKSERTESIGLTDGEKVENHGFDIKKSFRNMS